MSAMTETLAGLSDRDLAGFIAAAARSDSHSPSAAFTEAVRKEAGQMMEERRKAQMDAGWARQKAAMAQGKSPVDAMQMTGYCSQCGAACWDCFPICGACDKKTVAATVSFGADGTATFTECATGKSWTRQPVSVDTVTLDSGRTLDVTTY